MVRRALSNSSCCSSQAVNVGQDERVISAAVGASLAVFGLSRFSMAGTMLAMIGGGLLYRGVTGHCQMYDKLGVDTNDVVSAARRSTGRLRAGASEIL